ncbi:MAG: FxsA family protein [Candidatus Nanohaloarchaeota archaeon QJJ-9]|nr:FxsA family protein [Candidatus Nanohaloarchaeota archaeon QJJ-9]
MITELLLLLVLLPTAEILLLVKLGQAVGLNPAIGIIVATGFLGTVLYKTQSWSNLEKMEEAMVEGYIPDREIVDRGLIVVGAFLLVAPGLITDLLGLITLIPFTRPVVRKIVLGWLKRKIGKGQVRVQRL